MAESTEPGRCVVPDQRQWGWAGQVYSLRQTGDAGIGDLAALRRLCEWSARQGASFVLASPLHALAPGQDSPYYPTSRCFRDPACLGGGESAGTVGELVDRAGARARKLAARLAAYPDRPPGDPTGFVEEKGELLRGFAAFCVLASRLGWDYRVWPDEQRLQPRSTTDEVWRREPDEAGFIVSLQVDLEREVQSVAATGCGLVNDIAVGVDPGGFDAWWWQEGLVPGHSIGAPPDEFNADGQDWGVAAFEADWLRTVDLAARHAAGLRVDHVMGLSRQWLVPHGAGPLEGEYVRFPFEDLAARLVQRSRQWSTWVVGEDLGTVEDGFRPELARRQILSMKVARFEEDPPAEWPELALAMASTHDLPPLETGADDLHAALAASPCLAVAPTLEDALGVTEPPNRPGVDHPHNWRRSLPAPLDALLEGPDLARAAGLMGLRSRR
jgi:4-alpha-glucanotransferase